MIGGTLFGVPVRVGVPFLLTVGLLGWGFPGGPLWFAAIATLGILVHEFGHVAAFRLFGHRAEVELVALGGLTRSVDGPPLRPLQHFVVSLGGPAAGLLSAAVAWGILVLWSDIGAPSADDPARRFLDGFILLQIVWSVFNLLPIRPLDGGQALFALLATVAPTWAEPGTRALSAALSGAGLVVALVFSEMWMTLLAGLSFASNAVPLWRWIQARRHQPALEAAGAALQREAWDEALAALETLPRGLVDPRVAAEIGAVSFQRGAWAEAERGFALAFAWTGEAVFLLDVARARSRAGRHREALDALLDAVEAGFADGARLARDPDLAALRGMPGWDAIVDLVAEASRAAVPPP